jgi:Na+/H+-dicarboxylate symporter
MIKVSSAKRRIRLPLYGRVLIGAILGISFGILFKNEAYLLGLKNEDLGQLGMLVVRLLKALAIPLILFAILDAFIHTDITARHGGRLLLICLVNVSVAMAIGLTIMNTFEPGKEWSGKLEEMVAGLQQPASPLAKPAETPQATLNPLKNLVAYIPESLTEPFLKNNVISVVLLGILVGAAVRHVKYRQHAANQNSIAALEQGVEAIFRS